MLQLLDTYSTVKLNETLVHLITFVIEVSATHEHLLLYEAEFLLKKQTVLKS